MFSAGRSGALGIVLGILVGCSSGHKDGGTGTAPKSTGSKSKISSTVDGGSKGSAGSGAGTKTASPIKATPSGPWASMGYDLRNNYQNPNETTISVDNAQQLTELWVVTVAGFPPGTPTIADGKVFVLATGGLYAFDFDDGTQLWTRMDVIGTSSLTYQDGFLYVHTYGSSMSGGSPSLYKLDASDGSTVWGPSISYEHPNADGTSSPIVADGKVLVGHSGGGAEVGFDTNAPSSVRGGVEAFDAETGVRLWQYWTTGAPDSAENGANVWSSVSVDVDTGTVYASTGNNYTTAGPNSDAIHAFDLATGTKKWVTQVRQGDQWILLKPSSQDTDFGANPILADVSGMKLVAAGDKASAFWALDRETGSILWSRPDLSASHQPANGGVLNNGAFDGRAFFVVSNDPAAKNSVLHKLDPMDGHDLWPPKTYPKITWGMPSLANGVLFVPLDDDLVVLDADTGDELNRFNTGGTIAGGAAAIADGKVVVKSGLQYPLGTVKMNNQIHCYGFK